MDTTADRELTLDDFDYSLPAELIAQHPLPQRSSSRLLHVAGAQRAHLRFTDLERLVEPGSVLVFNDTRVTKARLLGHKPTGGKVEALVERIVAPTRALALLRTSHTVRPGSVFRFGGADATAAVDAKTAAANEHAGAVSAAAPAAVDATAAAANAVVVARHDDFFELEFDRDVAGVLDALGHVPLPPYIAHADDASDAARYQTVYARVPGAVAAPTAGLHFTDELLAALRARGVEFAHVTLHVGAGTFQPVRVHRVTDHRMHSERYTIPLEAARTIEAARADGRRIVAVGTTALRALESAALRAPECAALPAPESAALRAPESAALPGDEAAHPARIAPGSGETALFITPGFRFRIVDRLLTNFHLPRSTLLMLVSAFAGMETIRAAYADAVARRYRFFSYGDAMLLERA